MRILLVEDDSETASCLTRGLRQEGHAVCCAKDGPEGLFEAAAGTYDVLVVDRMLPRLDGLALVKAVRASGNRTPVLFLTTMSAIEDRVDGLNAGGDDYLVKPFAFAELIARLGALARRPRESVAETSLRVADLEVDLLRRSASRAGRILPLQPREFRLLCYLMRHAGHVVTRTMLLENVWDYHFEPSTNIVDPHVSRLRAKVDRDFSRPLIHTVRGAGYCIRESD